MGVLDGKGGIWTVVVLLLLAGAVYFAFGRRSSYHPPSMAFFVDEETGKETIGPLTDIPPLNGASGKPTVVREYKYSNDGGKTVKVGYYFKYTESMKKKLEDAIAAGKGPADVDAASGQLVRSPAPGSKWVPVGSDDGNAATNIQMPPSGKEDLFMIIDP